MCLTSNHGEAFYDYELLYFLDNAGYTIYYMDLFNDTIPANCDLIISFNPNTDLIHDDVAGKSEVDVINQFLSVDGHSFFVFIENGTPALPNFESLMNAWGIASAHNNGYRYMLKDTTRTLTSDGYTIYGNVADNQTAKSMLDAMEKSPVFKDATAFTVASTGYTANGNGTYTSASRTLIPVYQSSKSAEAWVNGNAVDSGEMHMMMLTEQQNTVGKSYFVALSSTDFCTENYLQSAVYGNADLLNMVLTYTGKTQTLAGLNYIPFQSTDISSVTTRQMVAWTLCLTLIPTAILTTACIVVMRRRKNA